MSENMNTEVTEMTGEEIDTLRSCEETIARELKHFVRVGRALKTIRDDDLYKARGHHTFEEYVYSRWEMSRSRAYQYIDAAVVVDNLEGISDEVYVPQRESHARPLRYLSHEMQTTVCARIREKADPKEVTAKLVEDTIKEIQGTSSEKATESSSDAGEAAGRVEEEVVSEAARALPGCSVLVPSSMAGNDAVEYDPERSLIPWGKAPADLWKVAQEMESETTLDRDMSERSLARWAWAPVVASMHEYPFGLPVLEEERTGATLVLDQLPALSNTESEENANVLGCPGMDLFAPVVPDAVIRAVLQAAGDAPEWNVLLLTGHLGRLADFDVPANVWVGTEATTPSELEEANRCFQELDVPVRWVKCDPRRVDLASVESFAFNMAVLESLIEKPLSWNDLQRIRQKGCAITFRKPMRVDWVEYPPVSPPVGERAPDREPVSSSGVTLPALQPA